MDFISENYLWIILIVIVILMAIVGYIADKKGFINKTERLDEPKKKSNEQPVIIENKGIDELLNSEPKKEEKTKKEEKQKKERKKKDKKSKEKVEDIPLNEEPIVPIVEETNSNENVSVNINDDIMSPLVSEPIAEDNGTIDESLFAPLESTDFVGSEDVQNELNPIEVTTLQDMDNSEESAVVNEQEDIWKF